MPPRTHRFPPPIRSRAKREATIDVPTTGGVHTGLPPHRLPKGFSPDCRNLVYRVDGFTTPRSGLSKTNTYDFGGAVLGAAEVFDVFGNSCGVAPSAVSVAFLHPDADVWSDLSYVPSNQTSMQGNISGTSTDYFRTEGIFDLATENFIAILSNATDSLKFFTVASNASEFSDFSWVDSLDSTSKAKDVVAVNDRLVFFNTESSGGTTFPTRVLWSARGDPKNYDIASGAGYEDLMDMRGKGQRAVRVRDFLILFTEIEIWRATPTLDDYAFRFDRVRDSQGCRWPKTISATPYGAVFLGRDLEVYITDGSSVMPVGAVAAQGPSRIQTLLRDSGTLFERAWSLYNQNENRYELYYVGNDSSDGYPNRALFYEFNDRNWWPQTFTHGLSSGLEMVGLDDVLTYDGAGTLTYDESNLGYDDYDAPTGERSTTVFHSLGTSLNFISSQTNDAGSAIDVRWKSPGFGDASVRQRHLTEVWVDYDTREASTASVFVGNSYDATDIDSGTSFSFSSNGDPTYIPVWKTERAPNFEIRLNDGGQPQIAAFSVTIKDASRF